MPRTNENQVLVNQQTLFESPDFEQKIALKQKRKTLFKEALISYRDIADNFGSRDLEKLYRQVEPRIEEVSQILFVALKASPELQKICKNIAQSSSAEVDKTLLNLHRAPSHEGLGEDLYKVVKSFFYRNLEDVLGHNIEALKAVMNSTFLAYAKNESFVQPQKKHLQLDMWQRLETKPEFLFLPDFTKEVYEKFFQNQLQSQLESEKEKQQRLLKEEFSFAKSLAVASTLEELVRKYSIKSEFQEIFFEAIKESFLTGREISFERVLSEKIGLDNLDQIFAAEKISNNSEQIIDQFRQEIGQSFNTYLSQLGQTLAATEEVVTKKGNAEIASFIKALPKEIFSKEANFFRLNLLFNLPQEKAESLQFDGAKFFTPLELNLMKKINIAVQLFPDFEEINFGEENIIFCAQHFLQEIAKKPEILDNILTPQQWQNVFQKAEKTPEIKEHLAVGEFDDLYDSLTKIRSFCDHQVLQYQKEIDDNLDLRLAPIKAAEANEKKIEIIKPKKNFASLESSISSESVESSDNDLSKIQISFPPKSSFKASQASAFNAVNSKVR